MPAHRLPALPVDDLDAAVAWTAEHLGDLAREGRDGIRPSPRFRGGQRAATVAMRELDLRGYASRRNQVLPESARGASAVSPYVRHGLIPLQALWAAAGQAPARDAKKYRDELLWQEYARHLYARTGTALRHPLRYEPARAQPPWEKGWPTEMNCLNWCREELERDGWLVNQTRMWMSSQWTVRAGQDWREGEDAFFAHLLDGSRAANRLGWQWTIGSGTGRPYSFSRWQVQKRAPELCERCALNADCPIAGWPGARREGGTAAEDAASVRALLRRDPDLAATRGPAQVETRSVPDAVWLTAESLGDADPALDAHPDLPVVFVFDEPLLARLRLSGKRLTFFVETLADLAARREVRAFRGRVAEELEGLSPAVTFAPVPGFRRIAQRVAVAETHPWPWLAPPHDGPVTSYSAWRKRALVASTSSEPPATRRCSTSRDSVDASARTRNMPRAGADQYGKRDADLIVHEREPFNAETGLAALASALTPTAAFYVRGHGTVPSAVTDDWRLRVHGLVGRELSMSLEALREALPEREITATLQCAGNRRAGLLAVRDIPGEAPWGPGATGTATWTGCALADLLALAGPRDDATHVGFEGSDRSAEVSPPERFGGSIPIDKARRPEVLLAWGMNGRPLPLVHGAPLRVVVPGYIGARSVKWLERIELRASPWPGHFQQVVYRLLPAEGTPGPGAGEPLGLVALNSDVLSPADGATVPAGALEVRGYAFAGGERHVIRVDVSVDGGASWDQAELLEDLGQWAWRQWRASVDLSPGEHEILVRAWDSSAATQPDDEAGLWNPKGYVNNARPRIRVRVI